MGAKAEIYALMKRLADAGMSILVTSSELPELLAVCDRILVLCEGRLTADLPRREATEETIMHAATRFLDRGAKASWRWPGRRRLPRSPHQTRRKILRRYIQNSISHITSTMPAPRTVGSYSGPKTLKVLWPRCVLRLAAIQPLKSQVIR